MDSLVPRLFCSKDKESVHITIIIILGLAEFYTRVPARNPTESHPISANDDLPGLRAAP